MIRSFFIHFLILAAFVYPSFVGAESIHLEEYDISRYPKVELKLKTGKGVSLDQEILTVAEQKKIVLEEWLALSRSIDLKAQDRSIFI